MSGAQLVRYEAARTALAAATRVDEVKDIRDKAEAMAAYARQARDTELIQWATEIKVRAERRAGELLREMAERGERSTAGEPASQMYQRDTSAPPTLDDLGVTRVQSSRWQKLAAVPEEQFEQAVAAAKEIAGEVTTAGLLRLEAKLNHRAQYTGETEWYTPVQYIEKARATMGGIDLDPASSEIAQMSVKAAAYYTEADNGLNLPWAGRIWLNPPYAQPFIAQFVERLRENLESGAVTQAITLTHNSTDTAWFHALAARAQAICFTRGRIGFLDPQGVPCAPTQGQAFCYFGDRAEYFAMHFASVGFIR